MGVIQNYKLLPKSTKKLLNVGLILALLIALPLFVWSVINMTFDVREKAQQQGLNIDLTNEPFIGYSDSPVTIVMYSDYQCEFCKSFIDNTLSTILSTYENEVKFVYKDFPLKTLHPLAESAAKAGQCAFEQDKFWEMHNLIFQNQESLTESSFNDFATTLSLDLTAFETCLNSQATIDEINADIAEGTALQVAGTPTFFINDQRLDGALPFDNFKTLIDQELVDDFRFGNTTSVTFTTTDQTPNISVDPSNLINGKTYSVSVAYQLQNDIKYSHATTSAVPVKFFINNIQKGIKDISYSLIATSETGANDSQTGTFTATNSATSIKLVLDPENLYPESNEQNNTFEVTFSDETTPTTTPTSTPTMTATPTATPTSAPEEPNSCGGTCGSNYNCKANLYCYKGFCRNPICSEDSDCDCVVATVTPTPTMTSLPKGGTTTKTTAVSATKKSATPKATPKYTTGMTLIEKPEELARDEDNTSTEPENMFINKYALYIMAGFGLIVLVAIIYALKKKRDNNIPHIVPPTNI